MKPNLWLPDPYAVNKVLIAYTRNNEEKRFNIEILNFLLIPSPPDSVVLESASIPDFSIRGTHMFSTGYMGCSPLQNLHTVVTR